MIREQVLCALTQAGLAYRAPRWEWDSDAPLPVLRVKDIIISQERTLIIAEELRLANSEGDCVVDDTHTVTLLREPADDCTDADWWDAALFDWFGLGRFGDIVLDREPSSVVRVEALLAQIAPTCPVQDEPVQVPGEAQGLVMRVYFMVRCSQCKLRADDEWDAFPHLREAAELAETLDFVERDGEWLCERCAQGQPE